MRKGEAQKILNWIWDKYLSNPFTILCFIPVIVLLMIWVVDGGANIETGPNGSPWAGSLLLVFVAITVLNLGVSTMRDLLDWQKKIKHERQAKLKKQAGALNNVTRTTSKGNRQHEYVPEEHYDD